MTSVRIQALSVRYGKSTVLDRVDLEVADGEFFFLLGPSGCGKTTLLRTIAGFVEPAGGDVLFAGRSVAGVPPERRDCGMVFQNYALWPHLSVAENVAFGLDVRRIARDEKARRVAMALRLVRMEDFAARAPASLSGGQQQRVALARALAVEPAVLLLDEPLSNLDAALRVELRGEIREIQSRTGRTALYVTHDRAEALALADRVAVLRDGRVEQMGAPEELYDRPATPFVAGFVGDANCVAGEAEAAPCGGFLVRGAFGAVAARATGLAPAAGGRVLLVMRPERLRLAPGSGGAGGDGKLAGEVARRTFLGEVVQHDVLLQGGATLRVLSLGGAPAFPEGAAVTVEVEDALVFPA